MEESQCKRKWEWVTQWGAGESGEKKEKELKEREGGCFILVCTQSEGSVSAIVPGLPVKTVRLPHCLFISKYALKCTRAQLVRTHSRMHVQMHKKPPKARNNALSKALATTQQPHQHSALGPASLHSRHPHCLEFLALPWACTGKWITAVWN